jgi:predicted enzyme related to lactoylglutathione lyase
MTSTQQWSSTPACSASTLPCAPHPASPCSPEAGGAGTADRTGTLPQPGGWNRIQLAVEDIAAEVDRLKQAGAPFRTDIVAGNGGKQALVEDPAGNPVELFEAT